jgi:homoserine/homoserine lactone efflux protein
MDSAVWLAFLAATIVLSLSPGPGAFSCISSGLHDGFRRSIWNIVGMTASSVLYIAVVALGLGALLLASETLFSIVKWLGVAYLVYLGIVTWRAAPVAFRDEPARPLRSTRAIFMRGFLVNITNPKGIVFFAAIFPQFIDTSRPIALQYVILGATTLVVDFVIMMGYAALAARALRVMREPAHLRWVNRGLGGAFVAAGVALAGFRRAAIAA